MLRLPTIAASLIMATGLIACQSSSGPGALTVSTGDAAATALQPVFVGAQSCWFASKDPAFQSYRLANEMNSFTGRPRFLLVPARNPAGRPLLVVQASGDPAEIEAFGPMMSQPVGHRIKSDIRRWQGGNQSCA